MRCKAVTLSTNADNFIITVHRRVCIIFLIKSLMFVITMSILNICILAMLLIAPLAFSQQCRQVTVCNEETPNLMKGDKGDVGSPGKAGPVGSRGPKGEVGGVGEKGMQGESCALGPFESTLMKKLEGRFV